MRDHWRRARLETRILFLSPAQTSICFGIKSPYDPSVESRHIQEFSWRGLYFLWCPLSIYWVSTLCWVQGRLRMSKVSWSLFHFHLSLQEPFKNIIFLVALTHEILILIPQIHYVCIYTLHVYLCITHKRVRLSPNQEWIFSPLWDTIIPTRVVRVENERWGLKWPQSKLLFWSLERWDFKLVTPPLLGQFSHLQTSWMNKALERIDTPDLGRVSPRTKAQWSTKGPQQG